ncbi:PIG-L family deacetylase [Patescibacteria group bacterium]
MNRVRLIDKKHALVIVAHPDDETIWMGGTMLKHRQLEWTIFSLCRASDRDRAPKFKKVCQHYSAKAIITDLEDEDRMSIKKTIPIIKRIVTKQTKNKKYNYIFTHGQNGEYGHPRHIGVYQAIWGLIKQKKLKPEILFYFNYKTTKKYKLIAKKNTDYKVKLTLQEFKRKERIMTNIYGFEKGGIDVGLCTNPEAFLVKYINN